MKHIGRYLIPGIVVVFGLIRLGKPVPQPVVSLTIPESQTIPGTLNLTLPVQGQTAVMASGIGVMASTPNETPVPIASVTKLMTAYLVLKHYPLQVGQNGPTLTMTPTDQSIYEADYASGDSVMKVQAGEQLTERQLLEGLLLPSGDNIATTLADWVDGSESAFVQEMNQTAKELGMDHTTYTDASGVAPSTVSTALDQLKIAQADMNIPAFRDIVKMPQATVPVAGTIINVDYVLGKDGIVGVKTGSTPQAGGCFVSARYQQVGNRNVLLLGAVLGQQGAPSPLMQALDTSALLLQQAGTNLRTETLPSVGGSYAVVNSKWGDKANLSTSNVPTFIGFPGLKVDAKLIDNAVPHLPIAKDSTIEELQVTAGSQSQTYGLQADAALGKPSLLWRVF